MTEKSGDPREVALMRALGSRGEKVRLQPGEIGRGVLASRQSPESSRTYASVMGGEIWYESRRE